jgi:beta-N-acetylhexosaminidase
VLATPSRTALVPAALLGLTLLAACGQDTASTPAARPAPASPSTAPSPTPTCVPAPLEQRAAAVLVVGIPGVTTADDALGQSVVDLGVGGLFLSEPNVESAEQVRALVDGLRARAGRPLLVSTDEESGRVAVTREIVGAGPSPRRLARQSTPAQVREFAATLGARLAEVGIDVDLAPLLDLDDGPSGGIVGDRSFSADPELAAAYGLAFSAGLMDAASPRRSSTSPGRAGPRRTPTRPATSWTPASRSCAAPTCCRSSGPSTPAHPS